jgi:hypothetical protein
VRPRRPRLRLVLVTLLALGSLGALVVAHPALTGSVWSHGDDLALATAWVVAAVASAWLFLATAACVLALGCARPRLALRLAPALPLGIRRLVEVAIVGWCLTIPALPAPALGPARVAAVVVDQPVVRTPMPRPDPAIVVPAPPPLPQTPSALPQNLVVHAGDSLWLIARASLTRVSGTRPDDAEVARYWHAVIAANRSTLRSGDPSLIFPGEIVSLPRPSAVS